MAPEGKVKPAGLPKTESAPKGPLPVSDTATPASKIAELPFWLQQELESPVARGGMNNHCIKLAPQLMREGLTAVETFDALAKLYPSEVFRLRGLVTRAEAYAQTERETDPEWAAKKARWDEKTAKARAALPRIIADWQMEDLDTDLPELELDEQRRRFLSAMFDLEDVVWIGDKFHTGPQYKHHFHSLRTWLARRSPIPGEFVSHAAFKPGTVHRNTESMLADKYLVLESDVLPPGNLAAVARYMRDFHKLPLCAIVTTGGKRFAPEPGLHFWFQHPGVATIDDWKAVLIGYGADVATIRGPQPVRLPGIVRRDTGLPQQLLWLGCNCGSEFPNVHYASCPQAPFALTTLPPLCQPTNTNE